ncbi:MAG TPA: PEP/pyruvate-binding domain-containing protein, partial [Candidatus Krumholzibacterium sp.]|nr:PEP/pyruvate-binding domain-containing protein [Candidatus Krumholzibacterium sp.]
MSDLVIPLKDSSGDNRIDAGNKAAALASIMEQGIPVPDGICLTRYAYDLFVQETGVADMIMVELGRKRFEEMRWEEMWDASLRIRNMFAKAEMPEMLRLEIEREAISRFGDRPVAVRSSSLAEDSAGASFAGLHESLINVAGSEDIMESIKLVWASLWSDAALLYRDELGLDMRTSAMAVIIQEMVFGEVSGVGFCVDPNDPGRGVIESVYGLNKGLVDGDIEPDRFFIDRETGRVASSSAALHDRKVERAEKGVRIVDMEDGDTMTLDESMASDIFALMLRLEASLGVPQDVEWTVREGRIFILQSRPITVRDESDRGWYMSLRRSLDNLEKLGRRIEEEILPGMDAEAAAMASVDL